MELAVDVAEAAAGDVGIDFGGGDAGVAEHFLDDPEIGAVFEEVGGEAVSEHVRGDVALDAGEAGAFLDAEPEGDRGERGAAAGEEDSGGRARGEEAGAAGVEVVLEGIDGLAAGGDDAFLVAFADDIDEAGVEVELFEADVAEFGEAEAGGIGQFEGGLIAQGVGGFGGDGLEEAADLIEG